VAVLHAYGDADDYASRQFRAACVGTGATRTAVGQTPRADLTGFEQSGKSAARPDGVHQIALREYHGLAGGEVRSHQPLRGCGGLQSRADSKTRSIKLASR